MLDRPIAADVPRASPPARERRAVLSRELSEFLIEFSIAVHRFSMYPPGHPSLGAAAETVVGRLAEIFESRRSLTIGVAHRQIVVEGVATDSRHAVLAELARKLHDQQIGVVSFERGTNVRELQEILQLFARDSEFQDEPVGLLGPDRLPKWEHARLEPVGYDELGIGMGRGDAPQDADRASQLWLGLAQAAMEQGDPVDAARVPEPNTLAHIIEEHQTQSVYDQVIVGYLRQLTDEIQTGEGRERTECGSTFPR